MRRVNVDGVIHATRAVIGSMRARRYGRIVNVSSIAAIGTALPGNAFYAAVKAEVLALTRRFAFELGPHGITVNAVAPGFVRTDMTQGGRGAADWPGTERNMAARAMLSRIAKCKGPEELGRDQSRARARSQAVASALTQGAPTFLARCCCRTCEAWICQRAGLAILALIHRVNNRELELTELFFCPKLKALRLWIAKKGFV